MDEFGEISSVKPSEDSSVTQSRNNFTLSDNRDNTCLESGLTLKVIEGNKKIVVKVSDIHVKN